MRTDVFPILPRTLFYARGKKKTGGALPGVLNNYKMTTPFFHLPLHPHFSNTLTIPFSLVSLPSHTPWYHNPKPLIRTKMTVSASTNSSSSDLTTESARSLYEKLVVLLKDISHVKGISSLLGWDQMVMMPKKAEDARGNQVKKK